MDNNYSSQVRVRWSLSLLITHDTSMSRVLALTRPSFLNGNFSAGSIKNTGIGMCDILNTYQDIVSIMKLTLRLHSDHGDSISAVTAKTETSNCVICHFI